MLPKIQPSKDTLAMANMQIVVLMCFVLSAVVQCVKSPDKPHIVYILADDWGWANVGYHRNPPTREVDTPNIDRLVKEGLELDQFYVYQFCSPSRSSLMSGRLPIHVNDKNEGVNKYNPDNPVSGYAGVPPNMTVFVSKVKNAGYATHLVGKWHAGGATFKQIPIGRGFDTSFGYLDAANDYYNETHGVCDKTQMVDLWDSDKPAIGLNGTGTDHYEESLFEERLMQIVNNHDTSTPLFLFYAAHLVHGPLEVPDKYLQMFNFIDDKDRQYYHAMVKYLDNIVGNLTTALKKRGMWDNLLLVTTRDNGGPLGSANNYPMKGGKYSDWQGGIRVNAFVSGGYLPEKMRGQKSEGYIHIADWYATFCALVGADPNDEEAAKVNLPPIDSLNMWPLISGANSTSPRTDIPASYYTLISGDYKITTGVLNYSIHTGPQFPNITTDPKVIHTAQHDCGNGCLYHIKEDPYEYNNLATKMPDMLKTMQKKLAKYQKTYFNPDRGNNWPAACETALNKYGGFWGPYLPA